MFVRDGDGSLKPKSDLEGLRDHSDIEIDSEKRRAPVNDRLKRILDSCRYNPQKLPSKQVQQYRQEKQDLEMIMRLKEDRELFRLNTTRLVPPVTPQRLPNSTADTTPISTPSIQQDEGSRHKIPAPSIVESEFESFRLPTPPVVVFPQKRRVSSLPPRENRQPSSSSPSTSQPFHPLFSSLNFNRSYIKEEKRQEERQEEEDDCLASELFPSFNSHSFPGPASWLAPNTNHDRVALPLQQVQPVQQRSRHPQQKAVVRSPPRKRRFLNLSSSQTSAFLNSAPLLEPKGEPRQHPPSSSRPAFPSGNGGGGSWSNSGGFAKRMF
jgi:hypothetical protein